MLTGARVPVRAAFLFKKKKRRNLVVVQRLHAHSAEETAQCLLISSPPPPKHTESHDHTTNTFLRSEREVQAANYRRNVKHGV